MTSTTVAVLGLIAVVTGVIVCLAMILGFLWKIYQHGGPGHVGSVAQSLRKVYDPSWPMVFRHIPGTTPREAEDDGKDIEKTA